MQTQNTVRSRIKSPQPTQASFKNFISKKTTSNTPQKINKQNSLHYQKPTKQLFQSQKNSISSNQNFSPEKPLKKKLKKIQTSPQSTRSQKSKEKQIKIKENKAQTQRDCLKKKDGNIFLKAKTSYFKEKEQGKSFTFKKYTAQKSLFSQRRNSKAENQLKLICKQKINNNTKEKLINQKNYESQQQITVQNDQKDERQRSKTDYNELSSNEKLYNIIRSKVAQSVHQKKRSSVEMSRSPRIMKIEEECPDLTQTSSNQANENNEISFKVLEDIVQRFIRVIMLRPIQMRRTRRMDVSTQF